MWKPSHGRLYKLSQLHESHTNFWPYKNMATIYNRGRRRKQPPKRRNNSHRKRFIQKEKINKKENQKRNPKLQIRYLEPPNGYQDSSLVYLKSQIWRHHIRWTIGNTGRRGRVVERDRGWMKMRYYKERRWGLPHPPQSSEDQRQETLYGRERVLERD